MTKEQLKKEKILTKITLNEAGSKINPEYKQRLENKLKMIEEGFKIKTSSELVNYKFIGLPSYDLRVRFTDKINIKFQNISKILHLKKCLQLMSLFLKIHQK